MSELSALLDRILGGVAPTSQPVVQASPSTPPFNPNAPAATPQRSVGDLLQSILGGQGTDAMAGGSRGDALKVNIPQRSDAGLVTAMAGSKANPVPANKDGGFNDHNVRDRWLALLGGISPALAPFASNIIAGDRATTAAHNRALAMAPIQAAFGNGSAMDGQGAPSPISSRKIVPILTKALANGDLTKDEFDAYLKGAEAFDPKPQIAGNRILDFNDPNTVGQDVLEHDKDEEFVYGPEGKAGPPIGVRNMDGSIKALSDRTAATEDAKNRSQAQYSEVIAAGQARGQAPYGFVQATDAQGHPITASRAYLAGREAGGQGPLAGQSPSDQTYSTDMAKAAAAHYQGIQAAGQKALSNIPRYQELGKLLEGFNGNRYAPTGLEIARVAKGIPGLGSVITDKMGNVEAAQALSNQMALELRDPSQGGGMPGALSDSDRRFLQQSVPGLSQSNAGRQQLVNIYVAQQQRNAQVADFARKWQQRFGRIDAADASGKTFDDYLTGWAAQNPLFAK